MQLKSRFGGTTFGQKTIEVKIQIIGDSGENTNYWYLQKTQSIKLWTVGIIKYIDTC